MDTIELVIQVTLLGACLVAAFVMFNIVLGLGMAYAGDGSERSAASAKERWQDRLIVVGAILGAIVIVGLLVAAFGVLWHILGLPVAAIVVTLCVVGLIRLGFL